MDIDIVAFLEDHHDDIVGGAAEAAHQRHLRHYESDGSLESRLDALFGLLVQSLTTRDLEPMVSYSQKVAGERFAAGFTLSEVQTAFNVLEENVWTALLQGLPPGELATALGLVSTVVGAGKDALARAFVSLASETHAPSLDLRRLFEAGGA